MGDDGAGDEVGEEEADDGGDDVAAVEEEADGGDEVAATTRGFQGLRTEMEQGNYGDFSTG